MKKDGESGADYLGFLGTRLGIVDGAGTSEKYLGGLFPGLLRQVGASPLSLRKPQRQAERGRGYLFAWKRKQ